MCGRYTLTTPTEALRQAFGLVDLPVALRPRWNIAPSQHCLVITSHEGVRRGELMRWGLVPSWAKDPAVGNRMINARAETVAEKPSFRAAFRRRRCLVPADGFYEWKVEGKKKVPSYVRERNGRPFAIAGLWECWKEPEGDELHSFTIVTTEPNATMAPIHDRMPAILTDDACRGWLGEVERSPDELRALLCPYSDDALETFEVSTRVNSPRNDDAQCIVPATDASKSGELRLVPDEPDGT